jgi:hypothetical protein
MWQMESLFEYSWQSCITTLPSIYQTNGNAFILPLINYQNNRTNNYVQFILAELFFPCLLPLSDHHHEFAYFFV